MKAFSASCFALALVLANPAFSRDPVKAPTPQPHNTVEVTNGENRPVQQQQQQQQQEPVQQQPVQQEPVQQQPVQQDPAVQEPIEQQPVLEEGEATQAEIRSIQAIHQAQLAWVGAHIIGVSRLDSVEAKQESWDMIQELSQAELKLLGLAREFSIPLIAEDADLLAMKDKHQAMLSDLTRAPKEGFDAYFNETIATAKSGLLEFLKIEAEKGLVNTEVKAFIDTVMTTLEAPVESGAS